MPRSIAHWFSQEQSPSQRLMFLGPLLLLALFFLLPPPAGSGKTVAGLPSLCLFYNVTGLPCPGCGITRSLVCCAHGRFGQAFDFHPLGLLVFTGLLGITLIGAVSAIRPGRQIVLPRRWVTGAAWAGLVLLGITWVGRLSGVFPFPP